MKNDLISIIVPIYNSEKYLNRCIDSILNQSYNNIEILLIDDGSTDNSLEICNKYAKIDNRVKVIHVENGGVSRARNIGIENAHGTYISFVDSDDWLEGDFIKKLYNVAKKYDIDVVRGRCFINKIVEQNQSCENLYGLENKKYNQYQINHEILTHFLLSKESIYNFVMLLFIKKEKIEKIRFNENLYMMEDVDFYIRLFSVIKSFYIEECPLYHYYINDSGATKSNVKYVKNIFGIIEANNKIKKSLKKFNLDEKVIKQMNAVHLQLIVSYLFYYQKNSEDMRNVIIEIQKNNNYKEMIKNLDFSEISFLRRFLIKLLINNKIEILEIMLKLIAMLKK